MRIPIKYTIIKTLAATFLLASASCRPSAPYRHAEGVIWNTVYHMTFDGDESLADSIRPVLERVGRSLSVFDPESLVSRLKASDSCKADSMLKDIYSLSARIHRQSGGMFDPTLSPLITAWGFGKGHKPTADTLRIDSLLALTGMGHTYIKDDVIHKDNRSISFNFSAIAKGYGCDAAAEMLKRNGVENFLVEIGGEIRCSGVNSKGRKWNISIDRPLKDLHGTRHASQEVITVSGCGVATSGNYRNFHNGTDGHSFGHTIDPFTGRPAKTDILSATVVAPTAAEADAYATACMAMGAGKAKEMLNRLDLPALLILEDFSTWASPEFKNLTEK